MDGLEFTDYGTDPAGEIAAFESGDCHVNYQTTGDYIDVHESLGMSIVEAVTAATVIARVNVGVAPYDDKRVRNAFLTRLSSYGATPTFTRAITVAAVTASTILMPNDS